MSLEIERKFLVNSTSYRTLAVKSFHIVQAYLSTDADATVRVRIKDDEAYITVKSRNSGAVRHEWEYPIPVGDARAMIEHCCGDRVLEKTRYLVPGADGYVWEVDEFGGRHQGLVVAEIELPSEDTPFGKPDFIAEEVTGDPAYYNSVLLNP